MIATAPAPAGASLRELCLAAAAAEQREGATWRRRENQLKASLRAYLRRQIRDKLGWEAEVESERVQIEGITFGLASIATNGVAIVISAQLVASVPCGRCGGLGAVQIVVRNRADLGVALEQARAASPTSDEPTSDDVAANPVSAGAAIWSSHRASPRRRAVWPDCAH